MEIKNKSNARYVWNGRTQHNYMLHEKTRLVCTDSQWVGLSVPLVGWSLSFVLIFLFFLSLVPSLARLFARSFVLSAAFSRSFVRSFVCSFVLSFVRSFVRSFARFFVRSFVPLFLRSFFVFVRSFVSLKWPNLIQSKRECKEEYNSLSQW